MNAPIYTKSRLLSFALRNIDYMYCHYGRTFRFIVERNDLSHVQQIVRFLSYSTHERRRKEIVPRTINEIIVQ